MKFNWKFMILFVVIFFVVSALAAQTNIELVLDKLKHPKGLLIGITLQYFMLPFLGYLTGLIFDFDHVFAVSLLIVSTCPGGSMSNVFTFLNRADLPLSLAMTTCTSLLSFAFIVFNGWLYVDVAMASKNSEDKVKVDFIGLLVSVSLLVFSLCFGLYVSRQQWPRFKKFLGVGGTLSTVLLIAVAVMQNLGTDQNIASLGWRYWLGCLFLNASAWIGGLLIATAAKLEKPSAVAMGIEISTQNTALAGSIIWLSFESSDDGDKGVGIAVMYAFTCWTVVLLLGVLFFRFGWVQLEVGEELADAGFCERYAAAVSQANVSKPKSEENEVGAIKSETTLELTEK